MTIGDGTHNSISGTVVGHSVQAGAIFGDVHFHGPSSSEPVPTPRQLLAAPSDFIERDDELAELDAIVSHCGRRGERALAVLSGVGGVGKTALALRWAHRASERFPDGQLYVDLAGFSGGDPVDPGEALTLFLRALGVPGSQVPATLGEQTALYRSLTAQRRLLVLLDNACSSAQVRVLLPSSPGSVVLVTSRSRLTGLISDGARPIEVRPLPQAAAVRLLTSMLGDGRVATDPDGAVALVRMCGCLPIAVRLAAARLVARPRWPVSRVVTELSDERTRLAALSIDGDLSVRASIDLSYRLLGDEPAALYRRLGLHPGHEFGPAVGAAVLDRQQEVTDRLLDGLVEANLVEEVREQRYRFHDLLRLHARQQSEIDDGPSQRTAALRRMLEWYLAAAAAADQMLTPYRRRLRYEFESNPRAVPAFTAREPALGWLETERANLMAAGEAAMEHRWYALAWQLADVLWPLVLYRKHYRDRLGIHQRGLDAARAWGNRFAEASMLKRLGRDCTTLRRYEEAERYLRDAMATWSQLDDRHGEADARETLGALYLETARLCEAVEQFEHVLATYRAMGNDRRVGLALINLAIALLRLRRPREALGQLEQAQTIFDRLTEVDPYNGARVLVLLGEARCAMGEIDAAREFARTGLAAMSRVGSVHGEAEAHEVLAEAELRRGDPASGRHHFEQAIRTFTSLRSPRAAALRQRLGPCFRHDAGPK